MELVYLWVEDYKNIKNQGFNFSPRFRCDYDEDANELTIDENRDYFSVFPKNISVTAIVGENGSGKSSVLELLVKIARKYDVLDFKCFFVYRKKIKFYIVYNPRLITKKMKCNIPYEHSWFIDDYESIDWINYQNTRRDNLVEKNVGEQSRLNRYGSNLVFKQAYVFTTYAEILNIIKEKYLFDTFVLQIGLKNDNIIKEKKPYLDERYLDDEKIEICEQIVTNFYEGKIGLVRYSIGAEPFSKEKQLAYNSFLFYVIFFMMHGDTITEEDNDFDRDFLSSLTKIKESTNIDTIFTVLEDFRKKLESIYTDSLSVIYETFNENLKELVYLKGKLDEFEYKNNLYVWEIDLSKKELVHEVITETQIISGISSDDGYLKDCISYSFVNIEKKIAYNDLSDGEKEILKIVIDLIHHLDINKNKNILFLQDEIDNSLHPIWKKEILKIQIDIFQEFIKLHKHTSVHLLFTTHSQFLISDIPKENVVFLKDGKQVYPFKKSEQTFGANIHTLLSHGFFLGDSLMGEFAKSQINEVIRLLKSKRKLSEKNQKFCENIISIIGEPLLKETLRLQLDQKIKSAQNRT